MNSEDRAELALAFIDHTSNLYMWDRDFVLRKRDNSGTEWAIHRIFELHEENPDDVLEFILEVLSRNPPTDTLSVLAAGPLEDYIRIGAESVILRVEQQAAKDKRFRMLLGGVWRNNMSDDVWRRIEACCDRSEWDV
jgi:hypothetical protein